MSQVRELSIPSSYYSQLYHFSCKDREDFSDGLPKKVICSHFP